MPLQDKRLLIIIILLNGEGAELFRSYERRKFRCKTEKQRKAVVGKKALSMKWRIPLDMLRAIHEALLTLALLYGMCIHHF